MSQFLREKWENHGFGIVDSQNKPRDNATNNACINAPINTPGDGQCDVQGENPKWYLRKSQMNPQEVASLPSNISFAVNFSYIYIENILHAVL